MTKYDKETIKEASKGVNFEESLICFIDLLGSTTAIEKEDVNFFNSLNCKVKRNTPTRKFDENNVAICFSRQVHFALQKILNLF